MKLVDSRLIVRAGVCLALAVVGLASAACSADSHPERAARGAAPIPTSGAPCDEGQSEPCGEVLAEHEGVLSCYEGVRRCEAGVFGECREGTVVERRAPVLRSSPAAPGGLAPLALSEPLECDFNPCDPACRFYDERPATGLTSGTGYVWQTGHISELPPSLVERGLREPCQSGADCQFNHYCASVVTDARCGHDKCEQGNALAASCDPCVARVCAANAACCDRPCAAGEVLGPNQTSCYFLGTDDKTRDAARTTCTARGDGWDLVSISSGTENEFLRSWLASSGAGQTWHGLVELAVADSWAWSSGEQVVYTRWAAGQPDTGGDEHCVEIDTSGGWHDVPCTGSLDYVCEGPAAPMTSCAHDPCSPGAALKPTCDPCVAQICATDPACCDATAGYWSEACALQVGTVCGRTCSCGPYEKAWAGHCYYFDQRSFGHAGAQAECKKRGSEWNLVSIESPEENGFVRSLSGVGSGNRLWIGLTDQSAEGTFGWLDGSTGSYRAWTPGEPNDSNYAEDCVEMWDAQGGWNDLSCGSGRQFVCEGPSNAAKSWSAECVALVEEACDARCEAPRTGECRPWLPGETDAGCDSVDLAVGVPCDGGVPVCNHGSVAAPSGVTLALFPAGSSGYPSCDPDVARAGVTTCHTDAPIPPGECVTVTGCAGLDVEREIVVNPPGPGRLDECSCLDNWGLSSPGVACGAPTCESRTVVGTQRRLNLFVALDRSGSMAYGGKWDGAVAALEAFFRSPALAGVSVALEPFPLEASASRDGCYAGGDCSSAPCSRALVGLGPLNAESGSSDPQEELLVGSLSLPELQPGGATPTSAALAGAIEWGKARATKPAEQQVVVLVTDGAPTRCDVDPARLQATAADGLTNGVVTYTIGMDGADNTALAALAAAGGGQNFVVGGSNAAEIAASLERALFAIAVRDVECAYALPQTTTWDRAAVAVRTTASGAAGALLSEVSDASACGAGWHFDDPAFPRKIELCPETCDALRAEPESQVEIELGCRTASSAERYAEIYEAACEPGERVQWGFLTYRTNTPDGSTVDFSAQVAATPDDLNGADIVPLATASAADGTAVCEFAACYVDVYAALGSRDARQPVLRLIIDAKPNPAGDAPAVVEDWLLTYSCPPAE